VASFMGRYEEAEAYDGDEDRNHGAAV
jgi:hypothetical protein